MVLRPGGWPSHPILDLAILGDQPPTSNGEPSEPDKRGFIYFSILSKGSDRDEMRELFEGQRSDTRLLRQHNIDIDLDQLIDRGDLPGERQTIRWVAYRGEIEVHDSLITMLLAECADADNRMRLGIWFGPDPDPQSPVEELNLGDTCADPVQIEHFSAHFNLCGE